MNNSLTDVAPSSARPATLATILGTVEAAILRVLAYHDLFRHPMTSDEIHRVIDLPNVSKARLGACLRHLTALGFIQRQQLDAGEHSVLPSGPFYGLSDVAARVSMRAEGAARAAAAMPSAMDIGRRVMRLPFVEAVAISGSLSKGVLAPDGDYDYFAITRPGRLWIAKAFIQILVRLLPRRDLLCANYIIDSDTMHLPLTDPFTAVELTSMIPVDGETVIREMHRRNGWAKVVLPHARGASAVSRVSRRPIWSRLVELVLSGPQGDLLDRLLLSWTRNLVRRKVPAFERLQACGALIMSRRVAKLHTADWRNRILSKYHETLDRLEVDRRIAISRGTDEARVLVASAFFYRFDEKQWRAAQPYPPLATLYAAAVARAEGFQVSLFDAGLAESERGFLDQLDTDRPGIVVLYEDGFNYLTKMCLTRMREVALCMVGLARARGAKVVVCSSDASDHASLYLGAGAHAVIKGEGEATLRELLGAWRERRPLTGIAGVILPSAASEGAPVQTMVRPMLRNLDELPQPAWDLVDMDAYRRIWRQAHGRFSLNISTTRGCPFSCNWCAKPLYGNRYSGRSPEGVVEEIAQLLALYKPDHFWITDDIFGLKQGWIQRFAELVQARGLRFSYTIQSRADLLLKGDTLTALAASGLETVWIGAESGSQTILDAMDKGITRDQIDRLVPRIRALGMRSAFFLQFGYPGEGWADIERTIDMVTGLLPDQIGISVSYPLPGTLFHDRVRAALGEKTNWTDSDDLDLMFPGAYRPAFYRQLHRHVHRRFTAAKALAVLRGQPAPVGQGRIGAALTLLRQSLPLLVGAIRLRLVRPRADAPVINPVPVEVRT